MEESEGQRWSRGCWSNLGELGDRPGPGQVPGNRVLGGEGWADGRRRMPDLEGIPKIIHPIHLFYTRKLRPKEGRGLVQGHTRS